MATTAHNLGMRLTLAMNSYSASRYTKNKTRTQGIPPFPTHWYDEGKAG